MREEALKLADEIEDSGKLMIHVRVTGGEDIVKAADMIRKLVAHLDKAANHLQLQQVELMLNKAMVEDCNAEIQRLKEYEWKYKELEK